VLASSPLSTATRGAAARRSSRLLPESVTAHVPTRRHSATRRPVSVSRLQQHAKGQAGDSARTTGAASPSGLRTDDGLEDTKGRSSLANAPRVAASAGMSVVDDLVAQLVETRRDLHAAREAAASEHGRAERLAAELTRRASDVEMARSDAAKYERACMEATRGREELDTACRELQREVDDLKSRLQEETQSREEADDVIRQLEDAAEAISADRARLKLELDEVNRRCKRDIQTLSDELQTVRANRDEHMFSADELKSKLYGVETKSKAAADLATLQSRASLVEAEGQIDALHTQVSALSIRLQNAEDEAASAAGARDAMADELETLRKRVDTYEATAASTRRALEVDCEERVQSAQRREAAAERNLEKALSKADELQRLAEQLDDELSVATSELARFRELNHLLGVRLQAAVADAEARAMETEAREVLTRQNNELERQNKELRRVVNSLMHPRGQ
jgi:chromosome segregation ATPase